MNDDDREEEEIDEFAEVEKFFWDLGNQVFRDLNLPISQTGTRGLSFAHSNRSFFLEGRNNLRLSVGASISRLSDKSDYSCEVKLDLEEIPLGLGAVERLSKKSFGQTRYEAITNAWHGVQEPLGDLFKSSDLTNEELEYVADRLVLPVTWHPRVSFNGWQTLLDVIHSGQDRVVARFRFTNRQMVPSILDLGHLAEVLRVERQVQLGPNRREASKISDSERLELWPDHITRFLFVPSSLTDLLDSREELRLWGHRVFELMKHSRSRFGVIRGMMISESAYPARISQDHLKNIVDGYRSGEWWDNCGKLGVDRFLFGPYDSDFDE